MKLHRLNILDSNEKARKSISSNDKNKDNEKLQEKWKDKRVSYS